MVGLDESRLYPSIYENDEEAFQIWNQEVGIPADRIFRFGKEGQLLGAWLRPLRPLLRDLL